MFAKIFYFSLPFFNYINGYSICNGTKNNYMKEADLKSSPNPLNSFTHYNVFISDEIICSNLKPFWKSSGLCPPEPHQESYKFLLSPDMKQNLFHIGSLPHEAISQIRIHWMLDLLNLRLLPSMEVVYNFSYLDVLIQMLWKNNLKPGFELMGNPSNYFGDFENITQVYMWKDMIKAIAEHYIDIYGISYVMTWNFETWNEPDHHDFDNLNFTVQGFLNYYDACAEGLHQADRRLRFGGPGGSCRIPSVGKSPICWALMEHCSSGRNFFTGRNRTRLDFISFHKKGNSSTCLILDEEIETIQYIQSNFPSLKHHPFYNDEADPLKNWSLSKWWRADSTYASMVVKIIFSHIYFYFLENRQEAENIHFGLLSSDNAFLSFFPNQFTERTLLARFQVNNTTPKYTQLVKKPVYSAFGLLSKLCPSVLHLDVFSGGKKVEILQSDFGIIATQCFSQEIVIVMYRSADIFPNASVADISLSFNFTKIYFAFPKWAVLEINNEVSNPFSVWKHFGRPDYPTIHQFSRMKEREEPELSGPWNINNLQSFKLHLNMSTPGITLVNICGKEKIPKKVDKVRFFNIWNQTIQISWNDKNRCLKTYIVLYSSTKHGSFYQLNERAIIFPSYWHSCHVSNIKCRVKGYYKIYAVDYWGKKGPDFKVYYKG